MTKPPDEFEAIRVIVGALQGFSTAEQERIIRWAREKLSLPNPGNASTDIADRTAPGRSSVSHGRFRTWKTVITGALKDFNSLRQALEKLDLKWGGGISWDIILHPTFTLSQEETDIELVKVSGYELRFITNATRTQIYERATTSFNLALCQPEDGPYLRLQYPNQPDGEFLNIAMEPIPAHDGSPSIFNVSKFGYSPPQLGRSNADERGGSEPKSLWVFRLRRQ